MTEPFHEGCFTDARSSVQFLLIHMERCRCAVVNCVCVTGTPPGPAGMNDGHGCNRGITRQWLGGDGEAGEAGDAAGSGKGCL